MSDLIKKIIAAMNAPPPTVATIIAAVTAAVSLLVTQRLIDNQTEQVIVGLASVLIPAAYVVANSIHVGHKKQAEALGLVAGVVAGTAPTKVAPRPRTAVKPKDEV
jgi:hypothetical protein